MPTPRIYVACLVSYEQSTSEPHGVWVDATQHPDVMRAEITEMLKTSPVEGAWKYMIYDTAEFGGVYIHESASLGYVHRIALALEKWPHLVVKYFADRHPSVEAVDELIASRYLGEVADEPSQTSALAAYIEDQEPEFWRGLPERFDPYRRAIARSEARNRLEGSTHTLLYAGANRWYVLDNS